MGLVTIKFEDHGQDILELDVDQENSRIVEFRPFQTRIRSKYYALSTKIKPGEKLQVIDVPIYAMDMETEVRTVKYPVVSVTIKPN